MCSPMIPRLSIQSNRDIDIDTQSRDCLSKHSLTTNNVLVNDYFCSRIYNELYCNLDMKSNNVEFKQTPNLAIFDKNTALNLEMSLEEIQGKSRYGIDLYSPDSSSYSSFRQQQSNTSISSTNQCD